MKLSEVTAAANYLERIKDLVERIQSASDRDQSVQLLQLAAERLGAEVAILASVVPLGCRQSEHFLAACDPHWCFAYDALVESSPDPWLAYALQHSEPVVDTELDERTQSASTVELAKEYGFCSAVVVPIPPARDNSPRGMLCLGSSTPCYFAGGGIVTFKLVARSVAMALHEWWMSRLGKELIERCSMTDDDLQLLRLVVRGCTTKDISRTLGLKAHAIDHRFIRINEKLGARSRIASATLMSSHGLL